MRSHLALLGLLVLPAPAAAQSPANVPVNTGSIEGLVLKAATGEPVKKARVSLRKEQGRSQPSFAITDLNGRFTFTEVAPGNYRLRVERNGFVSQDYGQRRPSSPGTPLNVRPGQQLQDVAFWLVPSAVLTGRIYNEDGEAIPRVRVQALRYRYRDGQRTLAPAGTDSTNDLGEYRIYGLPPGQYYVNATYTGGNLRRLQAEARQNAGRGRGGRRGEIFARGSLGNINPDETYVPTYYPGSTDPERASPLRLQPGDELTSIDFSLSPTHAVQVRGRVINNTGLPSERGIRVMLIPRKPGSLRLGARNATMADPGLGTFEIAGVPPGAYTLAAFMATEGRRYSGQVAVDVGSSDIDGLSLAVTPGVNLPIRVAVEGGGLGTAQPGLTGSSTATSGQSGDRNLAAARVVLRAANDNPFGTVNRRLGQESTVVLEGVAHNRYWVSVARLPQGYYLKSARLGGHDVLDTGLDLTGGAPSGRLEIVISAAGARVEGVVLDGDDQPFNGSMVVLVPEEARRHRTELIKSASTDQNGRFTLQGIAPGSYRLFAWEDIEPGAHQDPDFLRPFERDATVIEIKESSQHSVELEIIPATKTRFQ